MYVILRLTAFVIALSIKKWHKKVFRKKKKLIIFLVLYIFNRKYANSIQYFYV